MTRIVYIDIAKFIGIFLMVLCHAGMNSKGVTSVIYAFHMPLFFFLSGYLFDSSKSIMTWCFIKKKAYAILVPFFLFSLIMCFGTEKMVDWGYIVYASRESLGKAHSFTPLWFLPCFFLSTIINHLLVKVSKGKLFIYFPFTFFIGVLGFIMAHFRLSFFSLGYPGNIDVALVGVLIMSIGRMCKYLIMSWLYFVLGGAAIALSQLNLPQSLTVGVPHVEMAIGSYGNPILFIITATMLCSAVVYFSKWLTENYFIPRKAIEIMSFYGANTITVLCVHGIILIPLLKTLQVLGITNNVFVALTITLICFAILYPTILLINNSLPNIVGKKS